MPTKRTEAGKLGLFVLTLLSVAAFSGCNLLIPAETSEPSFGKKEAPPLLFLQENKKMRTADHAPNDSIGEVPASFEKTGYVISAKRLEPYPSFAEGDKGWGKKSGFVSYTDSARVYFMRDFNRLWDNYGADMGPEEGYFTSSDFHKAKGLITEYEKLRRNLQFFVHENSMESTSFQDDFKRLGATAIRYRIDAAQHVLSALRSRNDKLSSSEAEKSIEQFNQAVISSNQEVEKMNRAYAGYLEIWKNPSARKGRNWRDDFPRKYAYRVDG